MIRLLLVLSLAIALLGCERPQPPAPAASPLTLVDAAGREVAFDTPPRRIVVSGHGTFIVLHTLYLFPSGRERLAGVEQRGPSVSDFLPLVEPGFPGDRTVMGIGAGPEHIAAVRPDVVLMKDTADTRAAEALAEIGIPVVYLGLENPEQFEIDIVNLGRLLDDQARADEILAFYRERKDRIRKGCEGLAEAPGVLVLQYSTRGGAVTAQVPAEPWMQTSHVRMAGANPAWLEASERTYGWALVNIEQIARWDPDQILLVLWHVDDPAAALAKLKADPQWRLLRAVKDDQLHVYPADLYGWDSPEPRWILGALWTAAIVHPERFAELDLQAEARAFFEQMYGIQPSVVEEQLMPLVRGDDL